jgi:hypothetical protein
MTNEGKNINMNEKRMIVALAAEADDKDLWDQLRTLQPDLFAAGDINIKFGYYGAEGALQTTRPYIATRWAKDADDMVDLVDHARERCVCGCYVEVGDILEQAARDGPVEAVVIIGDHFHGDLDKAIAAAKQLRAAGTRVFVFQQGRHGSPEFRALAEATGGAHFQLNPHVERVAKRLPGLLKAVADYTVGGTTALEARDDEPAAALLEQMTAGQITDETDEA